MRVFAVGMCLTLGIGLANAAVDPALLNLVMPDAKVLYGAQVQQVLASPFGTTVQAMISANGRMAQLAAATGFDYRRDLTEILAASTDADPAPRPNLVLLRGSFQNDKILALAAVIGATITNYSGTQIVFSPQNHGAAAVALLDSSTIAIAQYGDLVALIDRRAFQANFSGPLVQKAINASMSREVWFATVTPLAQLSPDVPNTAIQALITPVLETAGGIHFDNGSVLLSADALTGSNQDASSLAGLLQFAVGMIQGNQAPQGAALLKNAQVTTNGPALQINLSLTEQQFEQFWHPNGTAQKIATQRY